MVSKVSCLHERHQDPFGNVSEVQTLRSYCPYTECGLWRRDPHSLCLDKPSGSSPGGLSVANSGLLISLEQSRCMRDHVRCLGEAGVRGENGTRNGDSEGNLRLHGEGEFPKANGNSGGVRTTGGHIALSKLGHITQVQVQNLWG